MLRDQQALFDQIQSETRAGIDSAGFLNDFARNFKSSDGVALRTASDIPEHNFSVVDVFIEARRLLTAVNKVSPERASYAALSVFTGVLAQSRAVRNELSVCENLARKLENENRPTTIGQGGIVTASMTEDVVADFPSLAANMMQTLEGLRATLPGYFASARPAPATDNAQVDIARANLSDVANAVAAAEQMITDLTAFEETASTAAEKLAAMQTTTEAWLSEKKDALEEAIANAAGSSGDAEKSRQSADQALSEITSLRGEIEALAEDARSQSEAIESFLLTTEKSQAQLDAIQEQANRGADTQAQYLKDVESLIARAEAMVSGATVAGLAKAFNDERTHLELSMKGAMFGFMAGAACLFIVTLGLAAYVLEIPISIGGITLSSPGATGSIGDETTIAGVLSRAIILLAPFWVTMFSARRYRNLFELRQQYSHKYNMAFSVDGFMQQAPSYSEQIAAWVFQIVADKPTSDGKGRAMDESPLSSIREMIEGSLDKFADKIRSNT